MKLSTIQNTEYIFYTKNGQLEDINLNIPKPSFIDVLEHIE